ncbi:innexin inx2 [Ixodes scapularis]
MRGNMAVAQANAGVEVGSSPAFPLLQWKEVEAALTSLVTCHRLARVSIAASEVRAASHNEGDARTRRRQDGRVCRFVAALVELGPVCRLGQIGGPPTMTSCAGPVFQHLGHELSVHRRPHRLHNTDSVPSRVLDTFCWIYSTFSFKDTWSKKVGIQVPYAGVDKYTPGEERVYRGYYQWVCFVLFFQAVLFYIPRYPWLACESHASHRYLERKCSRKLLVEYFINNIGHHKMYTFYYFICEILNFVNVIGHIYLMDDFLGVEFSTHGTKVPEFTDWDWSVRFDPMMKDFPRLT